MTKAPKKPPPKPKDPGEKLVNRHYKVIRDLRMLVKQYEQQPVPMQLNEAIYILRLLKEKPSKMLKIDRNNMIDHALACLEPLKNTRVLQDVADLVYQLPTMPGLPANPDADKLTSIRYLMDNYRKTWGGIPSPGEVSSPSDNLLQSIDAVLTVGENPEPLEDHETIQAAEEYGEDEEDYDVEDDVGDEAETEEQGIDLSIPLPQMPIPTSLWTLAKDDPSGLAYWITTNTTNNPLEGEADGDTENEAAENTTDQPF